MSEMSCTSALVAQQRRTKNQKPAPCASRVCALNGDADYCTAALHQNKLLLSTNAAQGCSHCGCLQQLREGKTNGHWTVRVVDGWMDGWHLFCVFLSVS